MEYGFLRKNSTHSIQDKFITANFGFKFIRMTTQSVLVYLIVGIIAGLLTIFVIAARFEIFVWLTIIVGLALYANAFFQASLFKHAFLYAFITGVTITATHLTFLGAYLKSHPEEQQTLTKLGISSNYLGLLLIAPIYWLVLGLLTGGLALLIQRLT
ncbi:hypothetical protein BKI52_44750 [marine bacterium AO1-C]|nr:hypothetical protein BKI52_44750 [marine bacterium AO1-C]